VISDWSNLPEVMEQTLADWPENANRVFSWWQSQKREMAYRLRDDLTALRGTEPEIASQRDQITVMIPTSPIPSHPSTEIIEETIASVRAQLPDCEIIIMMDGVRSEQQDRAPDYSEYKRRLLWKANTEWSNVLPIHFNEHGHQATITREALKLVKTPLVFFVEHDTPIIGEIDWSGLARVTMSGEAGVIRLNHEASILPEHQHLVINGPADVDGVPLVRTQQWSQRPHLARTELYRGHPWQVLPPQFQDHDRRRDAQRCSDAVPAQGSARVAGVRAAHLYARRRHQAEYSYGREGRRSEVSDGHQARGGRVKLGAVGRMDHSGLGVQTRNLTYMLRPDRVMLIDSTVFNGRAQHPEWYDGFQTMTVNGIPSNLECNRFLNGITHLIVCETPMNYHLIGAANYRGVKTFFCPNFEFLDHAQESTAAAPIPCSSAFPVALG
jgi:hypothetical protein